MKVPATIISSIAIVGSVVWFYFEPGFEPGITALLSASGLLWSLSPSNSPSSNNQYNREFEALKARWLAERAIEPPSIDDARWLLGEALDFLSAIRIADNSDEYHSKIDELTQRIKSTQNMQMYIDGGKSYAQFWNDGTQALEEVAAVAQKI